MLKKDLTGEMTDQRIKKELNLFDTVAFTFTKRAKPMKAVKAVSPHKGGASRTRASKGWVATDEFAVVGGKSRLVWYNEENKGNKRWATKQKSAATGKFVFRVIRN